MAHVRGRGYFSELGVVRTKPGRADSPQTGSKSCSDKLALRQAVSLLLTPTALLVSPANAYITTLVVPASQHSPTACSRAFGADGRLKTLAGRRWPGGYAFRPFRVAATELEFEFSRRRGAGPGASNLSAVAVAGNGREVLINGVLQGRKQFSGWEAASMVCKMAMWRRVVDIAPELARMATRYADLKEAGSSSGSGSSSRQAVKADVRQVLGGWIRTGGGDFEMHEAKGG